jgi:hypothetical protein
LRIDHQRSRQPQQVGLAVDAWEGPQQEAWFERLEAEHDNLRAALDACLVEPGAAETGLCIAADLWLYWHAREHRSEGRRSRATRAECGDDGALQFIDHVRRTGRKLHRQWREPHACGAPVVGVELTPDHVSCSLVGSWGNETTS